MVKNRKNRKSSSNDKLGLVVGLLIGSLPECIEKGK